MAKPVPVSCAMVKAVFKLRDEGKTHREIGSLFGYGETWSRNLMSRHNSDGSSIEPRAKIGTPQKFGPEVNLCVEQLALRIRSNTSKGIKDALQRHKVVDSISASTVRGMLRGMEFRKVGAIRDVLSADHKSRRVSWCLEKHRQLIVDPKLFENWLITDEVRISLDGKGVPQVRCLTVRLID